MAQIQLCTDKLEWVETDGEVVALDKAALTYLSANHSGALLWRELASGTTHDRLVARLVESFGIDRDAAIADVDRFLAELDARELLER